MKRIVIAALLVLLSLPANAETPEEWIALGSRVHGAFGAFIPLGIKIGLDATKRINANPRELTVLYYDSTRRLVRVSRTALRLRPSLPSVSAL